MYVENPIEEVNLTVGEAWAVSLALRTERDRVVKNPCRGVISPKLPRFHTCWRGGQSETPSGVAATKRTAGNPSAAILGYCG